MKKIKRILLTFLLCLLSIFSIGVFASCDEEGTGGEQNSEQTGGDNTGGEDDGGEDDGGEDDGGEESQPVKLGQVQLTISETGLVSWEAVENADSYQFTRNGGKTIINTTGLSVQLSKGQTLQVRAVGDGVKFTTGDWSEEITYGEPAHTCAFDKQVAEDDYKASDATCEVKATYYYSCECGEKGTETFEYGDFAACADEDDDHKCDVCGETLSDCADEDDDHKCDVCDETLSDCADEDDDHKCDVCGETLSEHTGGEATCTEKATCAVCGEQYGELKSHVYNQEVATDTYKATDATAEAKATYYYSCECGAKGTETFEYGEVLHTCSYTAKVIDDKYKVSDATCVTPAMYRYSCAECGEAGTKVFINGSATGEHTGGVATEESGPICDVCGQEYGEKLPSDDPHVCVFDQEVVREDYKASDATCEAKATYYYSCECGEKGTETFEYGDFAACADEDNDHNCDVCGEKLSECADNDNDHNCDVCGETLSDCADEDNDHLCDICGETLSECADDDNDHNCDVCGETLSDCADNDNDHNCDICGDKLSDCADDDNDHACDICGEKISDCADDDNDHACDICGEKISDCADEDNDHNCDVCGEKISDCADGNNNHKCDTCGETLTTCADSNNDHNCDICGAGISSCIDEDNDTYCDICGTKTHDCIDENNNHACDVCGTTLSDCADNDNDHNCDICGETLSECADNDNDHKCDTCGTTLSECADNDNDHNCDVCGDKLSDCADNDNDHACDICGETLTTCADNDNDHNCDVCGDKLSDCADEDNDHNCDVCGDMLSECADEDNDHNCDICGETLTTCADNDNDHNCDICGTKLSECADNDNDHKCDTCGETLTTCADNDNDHNCDLCGEKVSDCTDEDNDHKCDICGETLTTCADNDNDHNCDICGEKISDCADDDNDHKCDTCGTTLSECADEDNDHACDICGEKISDCADEDNDHACDVCGDKLSECADDDNDHACDICGETLTTCADNDNDHKCDICGTTLSECADEDNNHNCDLCGEKVSDCADEDNDHACDICGETLTTCADNDNDHNCDVCGDKLSDCADEDNDHACDVCGETLTTCADDDNDHLCDICGETLTTCADNDNDHNCDICGEKISDCADKDNDHACDICGETLTTCADEDNDHDCDVCGDKLSEHTGGEATCTEKATCSICGESYGELKAHVYDKEVKEDKYYVSGSPETGSETYYKSCVCGAKGEETFIVNYAKALSAPIVTINRNVASWTPVDNATGYIVTVNGEAQDKQTATSYTLKDGDVISVVAVGDGVLYLDSAPSNVVSFTLEALVAPDVDLEENVVIWGDVENAVGYEYTLDDGDTVFPVTTGTSVTLTDGQTVKVRAVGDNVDYKSSAWSNAVTFALTSLEAPVVRINGNTLIWTRVENAVEYVYSIDGTETTVTAATNFVTLTKTATEIKVKAVGDNEKGKDSVWSNSVSYVAMLSAPEVTLDYNIATWTAVEGAVEYEYSFDRGNSVAGKASPTDKFSLSLDYGETLVVRALGDNVTARDSAWSTVVVNTTCYILNDAETAGVPYFEYWGSTDEAGNMHLGNTSTQHVTAGQYSMTTISTSGFQNWLVWLVGLYKNGDTDTILSMQDLQQFDKIRLNVYVSKACTITVDYYLVASLPAGASVVDISVADIVSYSSKNQTVHPSYNPANGYLNICFNTEAGNQIWIDNVVGVLGSASSHVCSFSQTVVNDAYKASDATCTKKATYYYSCTCGKAGRETFGYGEMAAHTGGVASCEQRAICDVCGQTYGSVLEHTYNQQVTKEAYKVSEATCEKQATYYYSCVCGKVGTTTFAYGEFAEHTGGVASCEQRAICDVCGQEYGDLLGHTSDCFIEGSNALCNNCGNAYVVHLITVTFNSDGGSDVAAQTVEEATCLREPTTPTKENYVFDGWYYGDKKWAFTVDAVLETMTLKAAWKPIQYTVTVTQNLENGGSVTGGGVYDFDSGVTLKAETGLGYTFIGWYEGDVKVSSSLRYTMKVKKSATYEARWMECPITLTVNDSDAGYVEGVAKTVVGKETTIYATTNAGYTFLGWYVGESRLTKEETYTFIITETTTPITYTARWTYYTLTLGTENKNGGTYSAYDETKVTAGESVTLTATPNRWYDFLGWYDEATDTLISEEESYTFTMPQENLSYVTKWVDTWKDVQGYNYYTFHQLGDNVMPIGGWTGPNPDSAVVGYGGSYTPTRITLENYQTMADCGFNSSYALWDEWSPDIPVTSARNQEVMNALDYCNEVGMVYFVSDPYMRLRVSQGYANSVQAYMSKPAFAGVTVKDEPGYSMFSDLAAVTEQWQAREDLKGTLPYVNHLPNYAAMGQLYWQADWDWVTPVPSNAPFSTYKQWVELYCQMVDTQVFCYDYYPFNDANTNFLGGYYQNLSDVRSVTQKYNVPFWMFAQSGTFGSSANCRTLSYAEIGFSVHTQLAYGSKGVNYFNYYAPLSYSGSQTACCVDKNNNKTVTYDRVQKINKQIAAVGEVLLKCKSVGIIQVNNSIDPIPASDKISSYGALTSATGYGDSIVGCFEYRDLGYAYYIASNSVTAGATITLNFNGTYNLTKIQDAATSNTSSNSITVNLPAGEGVLVVVPKN